MIPHAFLGSGEDGSIWALGRGHDDAGIPIPVRVQSNPLAPAGPSADCGFGRLYITLTWSMDAHLVVTPIVDGRPLADAAYNIRLSRPADGRRASAVYERILRLTATMRGRPAFTYEPRGTWLAVLIEADSLGVGDLIIDDAVLEYDVLSPTKRRV